MRQGRITEEWRKERRYRDLIKGKNEEEGDRMAKGDSGRQKYENVLERGRRKKRRDPIDKTITRERWKLHFRGQYITERSTEGERKREEEPVEQIEISL